MRSRQGSDTCGEERAGAEVGQEASYLRVRARTLRDWYHCLLSPATGSSPPLTLGIASEAILGASAGTLDHSFLRKQAKS